MIEPAHMSIARRVARSMLSDPWDADDAAQEAAIRIWSLLRKSPETHEGAVVQAARWGVLDWIKARRRVADRQTLVDQDQSWEGLAEQSGSVSDYLWLDPWPAVESSALVREALAAVEDAQQRLWISMRLAGYTYREARAMTGMHGRTQLHRLRTVSMPAMAAAMGRS